MSAVTPIADKRGCGPPPPPAEEKCPTKRFVGQKWEESEGIGSLHLNSLVDAKRLICEVRHIPRLARAAWLARARQERNLEIVGRRTQSKFPCGWLRCWPFTINYINARQTTFLALKNVPRCTWVFEIGFNQLDSHDCCTLRTA